jgi:hypothetical protein
MVHDPTAGDDERDHARQRLEALTRLALALANAGSRLQVADVVLDEARFAKLAADLGSGRLS